MTDHYDSDRHHYSVVKKFTIADVIQKVQTQFQVQRIEYFQVNFDLNLTSVVKMDEAKWRFIINRYMIFSILESFGFVKKEKHFINSCDESRTTKFSKRLLSVTINSMIEQSKLPKLEAERHCELWTTPEQAEFEKEMNTMIHFMAYFHQRTVGAIRSRIRQQFLF